MTRFEKWSRSMNGSMPNVTRAPNLTAGRGAVAKESSSRPRKNSAQGAAFGYRSCPMNRSQARAPNASVPPSRSVVSRTRTTPCPAAASTHSSPFAPL
jgi:hypothetical protein